MTKLQFMGFVLGWCGGVSVVVLLALAPTVAGPFPSKATATLLLVTVLGGVIGFVFMTVFVAYLKQLP